MSPEQQGPFAPHSRTPAEVQAELREERLRLPFLLLRGPDGVRRIVKLGTRERVTIGRDPACDIALTWDATMSRVHSELTRYGPDWVVADDGLSRNGTFVNGNRLVSRHRLCDKDSLRVGATVIGVRVPLAEPAIVTIPAADRTVDRERITPMQLKVLDRLCAPYREQPAGRGTPVKPLPATTPVIAAALHLSQAGVKSHLRALYRLFGIAGLRQGIKRAKLVELAIDAGVVNLRAPGS